MNRRHLLLQSILAGLICLTCNLALAQEGPPHDELTLGIVTHDSETRFAGVGVTTAFKVAPDGRHLVFGAKDEIVIWDLVDEKIASRTKVKGTVDELEFSRDGKWLVAGFQKLDSSGTAAGPPQAVVFNYKTMEPAGEFQICEEQIYCTSIDFSPDNKNVIFATQEGHYCYSTKGEKVWGVEAEDNYYDLAYSSNGKKIFGVNLYDPAIKVLDAATGNSLGDHPIGRVSRAIEFASSPDRRFLTILGTSGVEVYDLKTEKKLKLSRKLATAQDLDLARFSIDGRKLAISQKTETTQKILIINTQNWKLEQTLSVPETSTFAIEFSRDCQSLYSMGESRVGVDVHSLVGDKKRTDEKPSPKPPSRSGNAGDGRR